MLERICRLVVLATVATVLAGCTATAEIDSTPTVELMSTAAVEVYWSRLVPCSTRTEVVYVKNTRSSTVELGGVETTCDCLVATLAHGLVPPGRQVALRLDLDLAKEPDFRGHLRIAVTGRTADGMVAFVIHIDMEVDAPSDENSN